MEVVAGDADDPPSLERAFAGAFGAFYWDSFIHFGMGPRKGPEGNLVVALPLGGAKLPGIASEDVGKCACGVFRRGTGTACRRFGVAGEILSGPEMAAKMGRALGRDVRFDDVPFDVCRGLGFPGADDLGNTFQFQALLGDEFLRRRDPELSRSLNPELSSFDARLGANVSRMAID